MNGFDPPACVNRPLAQTLNGQSFSGPAVPRGLAFRKTVNDHENLSA
jgi:hypothetical protein